MAAVINSHIDVDNQGIAWIANTRVKVIEVALDKLAYGFSPEEIHFQHPDLSLATIHAALAYYYDLQPEFDAVIAQQLERFDAGRAALQNSPIRQRLRAEGLLP